MHEKLFDSDRELCGFVTICTFKKEGYFKISFFACLLIFSLWLTAYGLKLIKIKPVP
jgi:hypothetical protein